MENVWHEKIRKINMLQEDVVVCSFYMITNCLLYFDLKILKISGFSKKISGGTENLILHIFKFKFIFIQQLLLF